MRTLGVIRARMSSTRFAGKVLAPIAGRPLLALLLDRLRGARVDRWVVATSTSPADDVMAAWGRALGVDVHRGSEDDVLARFMGVLEHDDADLIVRLTADDPFTDAGVVNVLVEAASGMDDDAVVIGELPGDRRLPLGYVPQVARAKALRAHAPEIREAHHRAHVLSWFYERGQNRGFVPPASWPCRPELRWTVDTVADHAMAEAAFALFGDAAESIDYPSMVALLDARPDIASSNADTRQRDVTEG